ncbi:hypothetical protein FUAX_39470 (plasmid) [Fulvitalea axinellae]|uniref:FAS1 domain-containing protein n=1 Tax=Fulvitalea axinellae TaxID=1182444 RepID=A0AAU9DJV0_9BACT|nr:hypothetical protein FUAX_39470 [Fulvitalea axinellae]
MKNNKIQVRYSLLLVLSFFCLASFWACDTDKGAYTEPEYYTALQLMERDEEGRFEEWLKVIAQSDYEGLLGARGKYTVLACENEGVLKYLADQGHSSATGMEKEKINRLVKNHIVMSQYESYAMDQGPMADTTLNGNYLTVMFGDGGFNTMMLNQTSQIVDRDYECSNGVLHVVDMPVSPIVDGGFTTLKKAQRFGILAQAVELTGYDTKLDSFQDEDGKLTSYTIFAEPDEVYIADGIQTVEDLIVKLGAADDYTNPENALNQFVGNHVLTRKLYSNRLKAEMYMTLSKTMVEVNPLEKFFVNPHYDFLDNILEESNYLNVYKMDLQARNAVIHDLEKIHYVFQPTPREFYDDVDDVPEILKYNKNNINHTYFSADEIGRWKGLGYIRFKYQLGSGGYDNDFVACWDARYGWFEYTTKPIVKGKYKVYAKFAENGNKGTFITSIDGIKGEKPAKTGVQSHFMGIYTFKENGSHVIRFEAITGSGLLLDCFIFKPVN